MTSKPSALVVAPTHVIATKVFAWLVDAGWSPVVVPSFLDAKQHLERNPALMIAEVRLGEYNGLHLALRAQARGIPVVVLGECDPVLQREAKDVGAAYLPPDVDAQRLLARVQGLTATMSHRAEAWHHAVPPFPSRVAEAPAAKQPGGPDSPFTH